MKKICRACTTIQHKLLAVGKTRPPAKPAPSSATSAFGETLGLAALLAALFGMGDAAASAQRASSLGRQRANIISDGTKTSCTIQDVPGFGDCGPMALLVGCGGGVIGMSKRTSVKVGQDYISPSGLRVRLTTLIKEYVKQPTAVQEVIRNAFIESPFKDQSLVQGCEQHSERQQLVLDGLSTRFPYSAFLTWLTTPDRPHHPFFSQMNAELINEASRKSSDSPTMDDSKVRSVVTGLFSDQMQYKANILAAAKRCDAKSLGISEEDFAHLTTNYEEQASKLEITRVHSSLESHPQDPQIVQWVRAITQYHAEDSDHIFHYLNVQEMFLLGFILQKNIRILTKVSQSEDGTANLRLSDSYTKIWNPAWDTLDVVFVNGNHFRTVLKEKPKS